MAILQEFESKKTGKFWFKFFKNEKSASKARKALASKHYTHDNGYQKPSKSFVDKFISSMKSSNRS